MVTRAAKDLLRNTIRSTGYHNRLIEEDEMWRQWEVEKGLTMMVTDDYIRRRMRMDEYPKCDNKKEKKVQCNLEQLQKQKHAARESLIEQRNYWTRKLMEAEENDPERWGHSGYKELYPEEFTPTSVKVHEVSSSSDRSKSLRKRPKSKKTHRKHRHKQKKSRSPHITADDPCKRKKKECHLNYDSSSRYSVTNYSKNHVNGKHKKKLKKELNYFKRHSQSYLNENLSSELETCHFKDQSDCSKDSGSSYSFKCESDASESSLQKRRDYLKRKLEEEEEEADNTDSSDCVIIQVCNKSHQKESSPTHHRRKRIGIDSPNPKTKLKSQVVKKEN